MGRNVAGDDRAGADEGVGADRHAAHDGRVGADGRAFADDGPFEIGASIDGRTRVADVGEDGRRPDEHIVRARTTPVIDRNVVLEPAPGANPRVAGDHEDVLLRACSGRRCCAPPASTWHQRSARPCSPRRCARRARRRRSGCRQAAAGFHATLDRAPHRRASSAHPPRRTRTTAQALVRAVSGADVAARDAGRRKWRHCAPRWASMASTGTGLAGRRRSSARLGSWKLERAPRRQLVEDQRPLGPHDREPASLFRRLAGRVEMRGAAVVEVERRPDDGLLARHAPRAADRRDLPWARRRTGAALQGDVVRRQRPPDGGPRCAPGPGARRAASNQRVSSQHTVGDQLAGARLTAGWCNRRCPTASTRRPRLRQRAQLAGVGHRERQRLFDRASRCRSACSTRRPSGGGAPNRRPRRPQPRPDPPAPHPRARSGAPLSRSTASAGSAPLGIQLADPAQTPIVGKPGPWRVRGPAPTARRRSERLRRGSCAGNLATDGRRRPAAACTE